MANNKFGKYTFVVLLLLILYLSFLTIRPFLPYIVLAFILASAIYPLTARFNERIKNKTVVALVMICLVFLILIVPMGYMVGSLISQTSGVYKSFDPETINEISIFLSEASGKDVDVNNYIIASFSEIKNYIINSIPQFIESVSGIVLGFFVMFFILFYLIKDGDTIKKSLSDLIPLNPEYKTRVIEEIDNVTRGVIDGQVLTAIIQGVLGGIGFFIFGIPNPIFWGFIMTILAIIPLLGTTIVWLPAGILEILSKDYFSGFGILLYGGLIVMNIDNILRPKLISKRTNIHPAVILVGFLGGMKLIGLMGFIIGPVILAVLLTLLKFYKRDLK